MATRLPKIVTGRDNVIQSSIMINIYKTQQISVFLELMGSAWVPAIVAPRGPLVRKKKFTVSSKRYKKVIK